MVIVGLGIGTQFMRTAGTGPDTDPIYRALSGVRAILTV
jgi:hypothetical protein